MLGCLVPGPRGREALDKVIGLSLLMVSRLLFVHVTQHRKLSMISNEQL